MNRTNAETRTKTNAYSGYFGVDIYTIKHALYQGGVGPEIRREVFQGGDSTCCLPYDPVRDEVVLIEQFRMAPYAAGHDACWLIETVAGMDDGEAPEDVARREAKEEAGCSVTDLALVTKLYPSPGSTSSRATIFIGKTSTDGVGGIHGLAEEGEDIRVFTVPTDEAIRMVDDGDIHVLDAATAILWLSRHRERLQREWA